MGIHYAFGAASGALYGALAELTPSTKIAQGTGFGSAVWFAGVELAIPVLGLSEPPWRYPFRMHAYSFISHLIYGTVTEQVRKSVRSIL